MHRVQACGFVGRGIQLGGMKWGKPLATCRGELVRFGVASETGMAPCAQPHTSGPAAGGPRSPTPGRALSPCMTPHMGSGWELSSHIHCGATARAARADWVRLCDNHTCIVHTRPLHAVKSNGSNVSPAAPRRDGRGPPLAAPTLQFGGPGRRPMGAFRSRSGGICRRRSKRCATNLRGRGWGPGEARRGERR